MPTPDPEFSRLPNFPAGEVKVIKFQLFLKELQNRKVVSSQLYLMIFALRATFWKGSQPALFTDVAKRNHFCSVPTFPKRSGRWKSRKVHFRPTFLNELQTSGMLVFLLQKSTSGTFLTQKRTFSDDTDPGISPRAISIDQLHSF